MCMQDSVTALELLQPTTRSGHGGSRQGGARAGPPCSLLGLLGRTRTRGGARLLRSQLLQPCTDAATLQLRCAHPLAPRAHLSDTALVIAAWSSISPVSDKGCNQSINKSISHICLVQH